MKLFKKSQIPSPRLQAPRKTIWDLGLGIWCLGLALILNVQAWSTTPLPTHPFIIANEAYAKGNFVKAAEGYEQLIAQDYESAELYYNLGNAYYKLDNIGKAILNY